MTSTATDQINGFSGSLALKQPVRLATLVDIVLEGLIAIDGIVPAEGDRVLVKDQATPSQNGIYIASSGVWSRAVDMDTTGKVVKGTQVWVTDGATLAGTLWIVSAANPIVIDTSSLTWQSGTIYQAAAAMAAAIIAATAKATPANADRFGYVDDATGQLRQMTWAEQIAAMLPGAAASQYVRRNAANTAYEHRSAAQVLSDIGGVAKAGDTMTGNLIINRSYPGLELRKTAANQNAYIQGLNGTLARWAIVFGDLSSESGSDAGSNFLVAKYNDAGTVQTTAISIARADMLTAFAGRVSLTAGQLSFPATQNPSSDANTLDDYEEGTWTPTMTFGGSGAGVTYGTRDGRYVKVGSMVWLGIRVTLTSNGSGTGQCVIGSLPFVSLTAGNAALGCFMAEYWAGTTGVVGNLTAIVGSNSTTAGMRMSGGSNTVDVSDTVIGNTATVYLDGWYRAAA